jgi:hypothetical protein
LEIVRFIKLEILHLKTSSAVSLNLLTFFFIPYSATMDFNNLKNTMSNLTLYDLKAGVRQLQNGRICPRGINLRRVVI